MPQRLIFTGTFQTLGDSQTEQLRDVWDERLSGTCQALDGRYDYLFTYLGTQPSERASVAIIDDEDAVLRAAALRTALVGLLTAGGGRIACWLTRPFFWEITNQIHEWTVAQNTAGAYNFCYTQTLINRM